MHTKHVSPLFKQHLRVDALLKLILIHPVQPCNVKINFRVTRSHYIIVILKYHTKTFKKIKLHHFNTKNL